ncbi:MAG: hypothetical protein Q8N83_03865 [Ignavibacteria bacterium]|nr:hypothetical protein [Ignavibacteria bacterium]
MRLKYFVLCLLNLIFFSMLVDAQTYDDIYRKIDLKLKKDSSYLNLHYIDFTGPISVPPSAATLPRKDDDPFSFKVNENTTYRFVFLMDAVGLDSLELLYIEQRVDKSAAEGGFFGGGGGGPQTDISRDFIFKDMYDLKLNRFDQYSVLYNKVRDYIKKNEDAPPEKLLRINPDTEIQTSMGISSRDNTDYLNFMRTNHLHWYPKPKIVVKAKRGAAQEEVKTSFRLDASFSQISFSHEIMDFAMGGASVEYGFNEKVLNLLPYQATLFNAGFRTLISISDKKTDLNKAVMVDVKIMGRLKMNTSKIIGSLPFVAADKPLLNMGTSGGFDIQLTRPFTLPFLNLYLNAGGPAYSSPAVTIPKGKDREAYFSFSQAEATMSFYWNASDKMNSRFRMDIGAGYYDVWKGTYIGTAKSASKKELMQDNFYPVVNFYFNFISDGSEFYGCKIRFFDSQASLTSWLKLAEISGGHIIRFEGTYISAPVARKNRPWENKEGGAILQLRYRYGF